MPMTFTTCISAQDFGLASETMIPGFQASQLSCAAPAQIVRVDPCHVFDESFLQDLVLWWTWPDTRIPLYIAGPTGCGKTTSVLQFLARVHVPVISLTCSRPLGRARRRLRIDRRTGHHCVENRSRTAHQRVFARSPGSLGGRQRHLRRAVNHDREDWFEHSQTRQHPGHCHRQLPLRYAARVGIQFSQPTGRQHVRPLLAYGSRLAQTRSGSPHRPIPL